MIFREIVHVVSGFPLHFMFYHGNLDCFSNRVEPDFLGQLGNLVLIVNIVRKNFPGHFKT